jgi:adenylosuccinate lyase
LRHKMENMGVAGGEFIHLGLTSEDTNSLALGLMLKESIDEVIVSQLREVLSQLTTLAVTTKDAVLLARTHGQPAIPTTMGKEIMVFAVRLFEELQLLTSLPIEAKLSGAVGTFAAQTTAFPKADWESLSQRFITQLGLTPATLTTQIVSAEAYSRIFASIARINSILLDLDQDIWRYISDGYFVQQKSKNQVGSSTMPHKVNPIDFENSEGNLGLSNALLNFFIQKLPISRLQRDLSDSTVKRSIGSALGYAYLGYSSLLKGLGKITLEPRRLQEELKAHSEVVTEGFQVLLRAHGEQRGYEKLQAFSQGKKITTKNITEFIDSLDVSQTLKDELRAITPQTYIGLASKLVETHTARINTYLKGHS